MGSFPETLIDPKFSRCCGVPFTHHASFISWALGGLKKAHKWTDRGAASDAFVC